MEENKPLAGWQPVSNAIRFRLQPLGVTLDPSLQRQKYEPEEPCWTLLWWFTAPLQQQVQIKVLLWHALCILIERGKCLSWRIDVAQGNKFVLLLRPEFPLSATAVAWALLLEKREIPPAGSTLTAAETPNLIKAWVSLSQTVSQSQRKCIRKRIRPGLKKCSWINYFAASTEKLSYSVTKGQVQLNLTQCSPQQDIQTFSRWSSFSNEIS